MEHENIWRFDGLALFIRIVQAGGFASAERATGISKATLSRWLSGLEETLNVRLARRTTNASKAANRLELRIRAAACAAPRKTARKRKVEASNEQQFKTALPANLWRSLGTLQRPDHRRKSDG
jgi:hypothetical protein